MKLTKPAMTNAAAGFAAYPGVLRTFVEWADRSSRLMQPAVLMRRIRIKADALATSLLHFALVLCTSLAVLGTTIQVGIAIGLPRYVTGSIAVFAAAGLLVVLRSLPRPWAVRVITILLAYALAWGSVALLMRLAAHLEPQATIGLPDESEPNLRVALVLGAFNLFVWVAACIACLREVSVAAWRSAPMKGQDPE